MLTLEPEEKKSTVPFSCLAGLLILLGQPGLPCRAAGNSTFDINIFKQEKDQQFIDKTIRSFTEKYRVTGLSIAIAKDGEIILAKGYGLANREKKLAVTPAHQFRIASLSKPITAVAVMSLVEQGKISLDDKVFGYKGLLGINIPSNNTHVRNINVRHLLTHSAAPEWTNDKHDPMFRYHELGKMELVKQILKDRVLSHAPGSGYAYSNFGYCVLGLIIEKVSGRSYESFVQETIFEPAGARSFMLASRYRGRAPLEVIYYPHDSGDPYGFPVRRMDAHGGWVANAMTNTFAMRR